MPVPISGQAPVEGLASTISALGRVNQAAREAAKVLAAEAEAKKQGKPA